MLSIASFLKTAVNHRSLSAQQRYRKSGVTDKHQLGKIGEQLILSQSEDYSEDAGHYCLLLLPTIVLFVRARYFHGEADQVRSRHTCTFVHFQRHRR